MNTTLALPAVSAHPDSRSPMLSHRLSITSAITRSALFCTENTSPQLHPADRDFYFFFDISEVAGEFTIWIHDDYDNVPVASGAKEFRELADKVGMLADTEEKGDNLRLPIGRRTRFVSHNLHPERDDEEGGPDYTFDFRLERDADGTLSMWITDSCYVGRNTREMRCFAAHLEHLADLEESGHLDLSDVDTEDYRRDARV